MDFRWRKPHFQLIWILGPLLCALRHYNSNSNERTRDCVWRSTRRYHRRRLESDIDRFVVVPLDRIDCAVMGCFITIMVAHFPDERPEFACGYAGYECRCSETLGIDTISHATLEKFVSMLSNSLHVTFQCTSRDTDRRYQTGRTSIRLLLKQTSILSADFWNSETCKNFVKSEKTTKIFLNIVHLHSLS